MIIELDFREIHKTVKNSTAKPTTTTRPLKCNDRMTNGLVHTKGSKCLDVHASEKIIIL